MTPRTVVLGAALAMATMRRNRQPHREARCRTARCRRSWRAVRARDNRSFMLCGSPVSPPPRTPPHQRGGPPLNILPFLPRILAIAALALPLSSAEPPAWALPIVNRVRTPSFSELSRTQIHIKELESESDFFRARPRLLDFFLPRRMHYTLLVNPSASGLAATDPVGCRSDRRARTRAHLVLHHACPLAHARPRAADEAIV